MFQMKEHEEPESNIKGYATLSLTIEIKDWMEEIERRIIMW